MSDLELKVRILADDVEKVSDLSKQLAANLARLDSAREPSKSKEATLKVKDRECDELSSESDSFWVAISREERLMNDFAEPMCTG